MPLDLNIDPVPAVPGMIVYTFEYSTIDAYVAKHIHVPDRLPDIEARWAYAVAALGLPAGTRRVWGGGKRCQTHLFNCDHLTHERTGFDGYHDTGLQGSRDGYYLTYGSTTSQHTITPDNAIQPAADQATFDREMRRARDQSREALDAVRSWVHHSTWPGE